MCALTLTSSDTVIGDKFLYTADPSLITYSGGRSDSEERI